MIIAENIWKSYEGLEVLKGVNLEIHKSSITSIIGKSGTGKSTLLHILGTLDNADKGRVLFEDVDVFRLSRNKLSEFRNKRIGFVFQFHHLISEFTAVENVSIPALIAGQSKKEATVEAERLLEYLGLKDRLTHKPGELSGGEQQRVAVARALINKPDVVLADEPTGNLDNQTSSEIHQLLVDLKDEFKQTFVIVTHNRELAGLSDRVLEMSDGKVIERQASV